MIYENDLPAATPETADEQTIICVDDSTEQVAASTLQDLMTRLQTWADNTVSWLADNRMIIAPTKTKLVVTATTQLRQSRASNTSFSVKVGVVIVTATPSEQLLGLTVRQDLSWLPHFWGETWRAVGNHRGLIPDLIRRPGLLCYLSRITSRQKMKSLVPGMLSKLSYALPLTSSIWGLSEYGEHERNKLSCPKATLLTLQSVHRKALATMCPNLTVNFDTPTATILQEADMLSVHQHAAMLIIRLGIRIIRTRKPTYLAERFITNSSRSLSSSLLQVPLALARVQWSTKAPPTAYVPG